VFLVFILFALLLCKRERVAHSMHPHTAAVNWIPPGKKMQPIGFTAFGQKRGGSFAMIWHGGI
jgi:hypothetical protein